MSGNVFETLLKADQKTGELKPGLAESCAASHPTRLSSSCAPASGSTSTPLTADDVVFTFGPERFSGEKAPGRAVAWEFLGNLKEVVKVDALTVRVNHEGARPDDRAPLLRAHFRDHLRGRLEGCGRLGEVAQGARGHGSLQDPPSRPATVLSSRASTATGQDGTRRQGELRRGARTLRPRRGPSLGRIRPHHRSPAGSGEALSPTAASTSRAAPSTTSTASSSTA